MVILATIARQIGMNVGRHHARTMEHVSMELLHIIAVVPMVLLVNFQTKQNCLTFMSSLSRKQTVFFFSKGSNCEENLNECLSNPCQNGGTCYDRDNSYICSCASGFLGSNCDIDVAVCTTGLIYLLNYPKY